MSLNFRCPKRDCRKRRSLKSRNDRRQLVMCPACGTEMRPDPSVKRRNAAQVCHCDGYPYPHRHGTEPWCKGAQVGPSEDDWKHRAEQIPAYF